MARGGPPPKRSTSAIGWKTFVDPANNTKGVKNDCFIYAPSGDFLFKHVGKPTVNLTQFDKEVRAALNK